MVLALLQDARRVPRDSNDFQPTKHNIREVTITDDGNRGLALADSDAQTSSAPTEPGILSVSVVIH